MMNSCYPRCRQAPVSPTGHTELESLDLTDGEIAQLIAFLRTLSGGVNADPRWLQAP